MNSIYIPRVNSGSLAAISSTRTSGLRGSWWFDHRAVEIKTAIVPSLRTRRPRLLYAEDSGRVCAPKDRQVGMQVGTHCHSNLFYQVLSRPNDSEKKWNLHPYRRGSILDVRPTYMSIHTVLNRVAASYVKSFLTNFSQFGQNFIV